ncbi:MAG: DNA topoisomerase 1 [Candidatus Dependentiae bacterium ADurb.Bin331]|nr:MAG: DNA topoisomerase 1 [Candidatus Dependentiae bacterium ADurb.Bin331]
MKKLLIVESPAKIKTISKFLGKDFKIMSTIGHIKDLPPKRIGVSINGSVEIDYEVIEDKDKVIADICKEAAKSDVIYLAPDPDREGEIIAWHIAQEIAKVFKKKDKIFRITFNEITKPAITEAIEHPSTIDEKKVAAQQARRILDRWVGYEVSPILWVKIAKGLSAGRVQSVALKLICDRENEIRAFKPEEYWTIDGLFDHKGSQFSASLTHKNKKKIDLKNEKDTKKIVAALDKESFVVESITDKERIRQPLPPFMTSTLQQAAYNRLGFSVKKTMQLAQNLYEGVALQDAQTPIALITYMRTDSLRISDTALKQSREYIDETFGGTYLPQKAQVFVKGKAQDAHEAVRPIDISITPDYVRKYASKDVAELYELIWKRFIACQMKPAIYAQRQVVIQGKDFTFKVTGSTLIFDGFLKVYIDEEEDEEDKKAYIPKDLKEKDAVNLKKITPKQHFTQPPARFTEASLVKGMEKEGIGRPSTYATILNTIRARDYTELDAKKRFLPTELGMTVTKLLNDNLPKIMDIKFTALMEEDLDKIAKGSLDRDLLLREFYKDFEKDLAQFKDQTAGKRHAEPTDITCPQCKKHKLAIRIGKTGPFLGCMGYPECSFTANFKRLEDGTIEIVEQEAPKLLDEKCPKCGKPLRQLSGKFGPFIACSGYPECKYIKQTIAGFPCPLDGGQVAKKVWQGKPFWGCVNYPKCKFVVFGDIEETPCPKCKLPFLVKKFDKQGNMTLVCSNKECGYKSE